MLRQAKYKAKTQAVSKTVAMKLPSTLAFVPLQITYKNVKSVITLERWLTLHTLFRRKKSS